MEKQYQKEINSNWIHIFFHHRPLLYIFKYLICQFLCILIFYYLNLMQEKELPKIKATEAEQQKKAKESQILDLLEEQDEFVENISKINGQTCIRKYKKIRSLGKGGFAYCYETQQEESNKFYATKVVNKQNLTNFRTKIRLMNEIKIHKTLRHENIVKFYNNFEDDDNVYINLELCQNGSVLDLLKERLTFSTPEIQSFIYGLCSGLKYLHANQIIHRDLKIGNIFIDKNNIIKIGDFGLAIRTQFQKQYKRTVCGTPNYLAPQVIEGRGYYFEIDIWAVGIIIYALYFTYPPFQTQEARTTYQLIRQCKFSFPKFHRAPPQAIDLIKKILVKNPNDRLSLDQILNSQFMKLGGKILYGLPPIISVRTPKKKQLQKWPSIKVQNTDSGQRSFLGLFTKEGQNSKKLMSPQNSMKNLQKLQNEPLKTATCYHLHVKIIEQIEDNILFYAINNGNYGIIECNTGNIYSKNIFKHQEKTLIHISQVSEKPFVIPESECPYRIIMTVKTKELLKGGLFIYRDAEAESINLIRYRNIKKIMMMRLSNRSIQIIYPQKDSFVIQKNKSTVRYFLSILDEKQFEELKNQEVFYEPKNKENNSTALNLKRLKSGHKINQSKLNYLRIFLKELQPKHKKPELKSID